MNLPPEVVKTILALDKKIRALEDTKQRLIDAFGEPIPASQSNGNRGLTLTPPPTASEVGAILPSPLSAPPTMLSSSEKLFMFLRNHGPATRKEIIERSGVPDGSISYLLKNGRFRQRPEDEKWEVLASS